MLLWTVEGRTISGVLKNHKIIITSPPPKLFCSQKFGSGVIQIQRVKW